MRTAQKVPVVYRAPATEAEMGFIFLAAAQVTYSERALEQHFCGYLHSKWQSQNLNSEPQEGQPHPSPPPISSIGHSVLCLFKCGGMRATDGSRGNLSFPRCSYYSVPAAGPGTSGRKMKYGVPYLCRECLLSLRSHSLGLSFLPSAFLASHRSFGPLQDHYVC